MAENRLPAGATLYVAPVGTPPPGHADLGAIGPPIPVRHEERPDGSYVTGYLGPAHPAYAAVRAGLTVGLSVASGPARADADNEYYVAFRHSEAVDHGELRPAGLGSPVVDSLTGQDIESHRAVDFAKGSVGKVALPPALGGTDPGKDPGPERRRLNRSERRHLARQLRRG